MRKPLVYLHVDGAVANSSDQAAVSGVIRDYRGSWILGYNRFLGKCTPFEAELWVILDGLLILLNKGYKFALILSDNAKVITTLSAKRMEDSSIIIL